MDTPVVGNIITNPLGAETTYFRNRLVPKYFEATFQFTDNKNRKVTRNNVNNFARWKAVLWLRMTNDDSAEIVKIDIVGAQNNPEYAIFTTRPLQPEDLLPVQARHLELIKTKRTKLISFALQALIQNVETVVSSSGNTEFRFTKKRISLQELEAVDDRIQEVGYRRLDDKFLVEFADRWNRLVDGGETKVVPSLLNQYYRDCGYSTLERWAKLCRQRGIAVSTVSGKKISTSQSGKTKTPKQKGKNGTTKKATKTIRN